ncbi:MAG TPA: aa3-type cytochrome c oxidase subunit IV [Rhizomicrobium sp.]|nr:aa3-type cytochrome c oxidase subunit IV [Rhizomicrobium sp.]
MSASETDKEILAQGGGQTGTMDLKDHLRTWHGFVAFVKWMSLSIAIIMILLAIFRTNG